MAERFFEVFPNEFRIDKIIDSDKNRKGNLFLGYYIQNNEDVDWGQNQNIIVTSKFYYEIKDYLELKGLKEDVDFISVDKFITIYKWFHDIELWSREFDISITSRCTLQCDYCNMQMKKFKKKEDFDFADMCKEVEDYFRWIDHVYYIGVLGGEPFLHPMLNDFLEYICVNFRDRFDVLEVLTNGTLPPDEDFIGLANEYGIGVQLSDYSGTLPQINQKITYTIECLKAANISISHLKYNEWLDFGLSDDLNESEEQLRHKYKYCNHFWGSVYRGTYYSCHLQTSAERAGIHMPEDDDIFDLSQDVDANKVFLMEYILRNSNKGYLSFCRECNGCSAVNDKYVRPAIQTISEDNYCGNSIEG